MPSTAQGFAAGFTGALAQSINAKRELQKREEEKGAQQALQAINILLGSGQVASVGDIPPELWEKALPGAGKGKKGTKGGGGPLDVVSQVLDPVLSRQGAAQPTTGTPVTLTPPQGASAPPAAPEGPPPTIATQPVTLSRPPGVTAPDRQTLFGVSLMTPEEAAQRKAEREVGAQSTILQRQIQVARESVLPALRAVDPTATMRDALVAMGVPVDTLRQGTIPQVGTLGDFILSREAALGRKFTAEEKLAARTEWEQAGGNAYRYGVDREALAKALFNKTFNDLAQAEAEIVMREEKALLETEAASRALGTGTGRFRSPVDIPTAQTTGVPVGTTAEQVAGQQVPTMAQQDRRRSVTDLQAQLEHIRDDLLAPLPKRDDMVGGRLPGAVTAVRRRLPEYRDAFAKLESAVNNVVNVVARSVGEQRGTQTERDAIRAEAAILQLRDALVSGDTQESATARIEETLQVLKRILASIPETPTAAAKPAGGFSVVYQGTLYTFDTEEKLSLFKRQYGIK